MRVRVTGLVVGVLIVDLRLKPVALIEHPVAQRTERGSWRAAPATHERHLLYQIRREPALAPRDRQDGCAQIHRIGGPGHKSYRAGFDGLHGLYGCVSGRENDRFDPRFGCP